MYLTDRYEEGSIVYFPLLSGTFKNVIVKPSKNNVSYGLTFTKF